MITPDPTTSHVYVLEPDAQGNVPYCPLIPEESR